MHADQCILYINGIEVVKHDNKKKDKESFIYSKKICNKIS